MDKLSNWDCQISGMDALTIFHVETKTPIATIGGFRKDNPSIEDLGLYAHRILDCVNALVGIDDPKSFIEALKK